MAGLFTSPAYAFKWFLTAILRIELVFLHIGEVVELSYGNKTLLWFKPMKQSYEVDFKSN